MLRAGFLVEVFTPGSRLTTYNKPFYGRLKPYGKTHELNKIETDFSMFLVRQSNVSSLPNAREVYKFVFGTENGFEELETSSIKRNQLWWGLTTKYSELKSRQSKLRSVREELKTRRQFSVRLNAIAQKQLDLVQSSNYTEGDLQFIAYTYNLFYPVTNQGNRMPRFITPYS